MYFQGGKWVTSKPKKKHWISLSLFNRLNKHFHQNDSTESNHFKTWNRWSGKSRPMSKFTKRLHFEARIFVNKLPAMNLVITQFQGLPTFRNLQRLANDICFCPSFLKLFSLFYIFQEEWKAKESHWSRRLFDIFSNVLWTMTGILKF